MTSKFDLNFVQKMSVPEKADIVSGHNFWFTSSNEEKGISSTMMTDGPSGLRKQSNTSDALGLNESVKAVCFPSSALTASSFDVEMLYQLGGNLGIAARAEDIGLLLGPGVNIKRSPLAGRNFEYFSEDPYVAGELGSAYVRGVQSQGVGVSVKHFAANNRENQRFTSSSNIDERALREIYLAAFEKIVKKAHPATVMCSYNAINGVLNSENYRLLTEILRNEWGFDGAVISDWGAVANNIAALQAGLDLEMPGNGQISIDRLVEAVKNGQLEESQLDIATLRVLRLVEKFAMTGVIKKYDLEKQHEFARKAADDSLVLLKNENNILPLNRGTKIAIVGELAKYPRYQGGGSSHVNSYNLVTPLQAIKTTDYQVTYSKGYSLNKEQLSDADCELALEAAKKADIVTFFAGVPEKMESEGFDKVTIDLPENQTTLIRRIAKVNPKIVVVLENGSVVSMPWKNDVMAILETYLAGEAVGEATWDVLTGKVNPSGKLAETFPNSIKDSPTFGTFNSGMKDENYHEGIFVGYRYYDMKKREVNFPFGFGLSYTKYTYQKLQLEQTDDKVNVKFVITNAGSIKGKETAQIYIQNLASSVEKPINELKGFKKVNLEPGESATVNLSLDRRSFSWYDSHHHQWHLDNGQYVIRVGSSSRNFVLEKKFELAMASTKKKLFTRNTYLSSIIGHPELDSAIKQAGLDQVLKTVLSADNNRELLENMPLRAISMLGATIKQIDNFLYNANNQNDF